MKDKILIYLGAFLLGWACWFIAFGMVMGFSIETAIGTLAINMCAVTALVLMALNDDF